MSSAPLRSLACALFGLVAALSTQAGVAQARAVGAEGAWELSLDAANRRCMVTLRGEAAPGGQALAAPAGCRKALPILTQAAAWTSAASGGVRLLAKDGSTVLEFAPDADGALKAAGADGQNYTLGGARGAPRLGLKAQETTGSVPGFSVARPPAGAPAAAQMAQARPAGVPAPAGVAPSRQLIPGRYAVLREDGKDTGCMVTLEDKPGRGPRGSLRAFLAPACRDQGLVIYDPVGWSLNGGKLTLYARKGHGTNFLVTPDGGWTKDPSEGGKPLGLKRI
jgi:hypothetical protein